MNLVRDNPLQNALLGRVELQMLYEVSIFPCCILVRLFLLIMFCEGLPYHIYCNICSWKHTCWTKYNFQDTNIPNRGMYLNWVSLTKAVTRECNHNIPGGLDLTFRTIGSPSSKKENKYFLQFPVGQISNHRLFSTQSMVRGSFLCMALHLGFHDSICELQAFNGTQISQRHRHPQTRPYSCLDLIRTRDILQTPLLCHPRAQYNLVRGSFLYMALQLGFRYSISEGQAFNVDSPEISQWDCHPQTRPFSCPDLIQTREILQAPFVCHPRA